MQRIANIIVVVLFLIWILPLGVFIKPEKEEKACNGQRAICMCSKMAAKAKAKMAKMAKTGVFQSGVSGNKEQNSSSMSPDFLVSLRKIQSQLRVSFKSETSKISYQLILPDVIEHVPKV